MVDLPIYLNFIFSFLATVGFAIYFNAPKVSLIPSGIVGGIGWILYIFLFKLNDNAIASTFFAACFVAFMGEVLARKHYQHRGVTYGKHCKLRTDRSAAFCPDGGRTL